MDPIKLTYFRVPKTDTPFLVTTSEEDLEKILPLIPDIFGPYGSYAEVCDDFISSKIILPEAYLFDNGTIIRRINLDEFPEEVYARMELRIAPDEKVELSDVFEAHEWAVNELNKEISVLHSNVPLDVSERYMRVIGTKTDPNEIRDLLNNIKDAYAQPVTTFNFDDLDLNLKPVLSYHFDYLDSAVQGDAKILMRSRSELSDMKEDEIVKYFSAPFIYLPEIEEAVGSSFVVIKSCELPLWKSENYFSLIPNQYYSFVKKRGKTHRCDVFMHDPDEKKSISEIVKRYR